MTDTLQENIGEGHKMSDNESKRLEIDLKENEGRTFDEYSLPSDVLEVIAKRLNVIDYLHFRATNRLFRLATPSIQWRSSSSMSMSRFDDLSLSPLFVFSDMDTVFTLVHPKHGLKYKYIINLPQDNLNAKIGNLKMGCEICYSVDGWILLLSGVESYPFFFNPFTKKMLSVTSGPRAIRHITQTMNIPLYNISIAFHNGLYYYLTRIGVLGFVEEIAGRYERWNEFACQVPCTAYINNFLVECDGNLLSVFEGPYGKWVQVYKFNESTMTWIKVENLQNHMLFVGRTSFSAVPNISGMENKIYFPRLYDQNILFYSLESNSYHTFENEVVNFHNVRQHLNSSWIVPRWN